MKNKIFDENTKRDKRNYITSKNQNLKMKYTLSPIRSEESLSSEKLNEDMENFSNGITYGETKTFHFKANKLKLNNKLIDIQENSENLKSSKISNFKKDYYEDKDKNKSTNDSKIHYNTNLDENKKEITFISITEKILRKAMPFLVTYFVLFLEMNISIIFFLSFYQNYQLLSAVGIVNLYILVMLSPFIIGFQETYLISGRQFLASNKFDNFKNIFLKTQFFSFSFMTIFILLNVCFFKLLLSYLSFNAEFINLCYDYFFYMIPFIYLINIISLNFSHLNILNNIKYIYSINLLKLIIHCILSYFMTISSNLSIQGIAITFSVNYFICVLLTFYFIFEINFSLKNEYQINIDLEIDWSDLFEYDKFLEILLINLFLNCLKIWFYQLLNLLAAKLSYNEFSVFSISFQYVMLFFSYDIGLRISAILILSKLIGNFKNKSKGNLKNFKNSIKFYIWFMICFNLILYTIVYLMSNFSAKTYFDDLNNQELLTNNLKFLTTVFFFESLFLILQEILIIFRKHFIFVINSLIFKYGLNFLMAYILIRKHNYGLNGIYLSLITSSIIGILISFVVIYFTNYKNFKLRINEEQEKNLEMLDYELM